MMRRELADRVLAATDHEQQEQTWLRAIDDFQEGVKAALGPDPRATPSTEQS
jgi:hypothetical protein